MTPAECGGGFFVISNYDDATAECLLDRRVRLHHCCKVFIDGGCCTHSALHTPFDIMFMRSTKHEARQLHLQKSAKQKAEEGLLYYVMTPLSRIPFVAPNENLSLHIKNHTHDNNSIMAMTAFKHGLPQTTSCMYQISCLASIFYTCPRHF